MKLAEVYPVLAEELVRWRELPRRELALRAGTPPDVRVVEVAGHPVTIEISAAWVSQPGGAIRVEAVANGPSHWRLERTVESIVVPAEGQAP